jgi:hypothetical protein
MSSAARLTSFLGAVAALVISAAGSPSAASVPAWVTPGDGDQVRVSETPADAAATELDALGAAHVARFNSSSVTNSARGPGRATSGGLNNLRGAGRAQRPASRDIPADKTIARKAQPDKQDLRQVARKPQQNLRGKRQQATESKPRQ